jgi:hypothetical protein
MEVLRGDAVGELVQVRLPDVRPAGSLEPLNGFGRPGRNVIAEYGRPVGRPDSGRVEEILDGEPAARRRTTQLRYPDAVQLLEPTAQEADHESQR